MCDDSKNQRTGQSGQQPTTDLAEFLEQAAQQTWPLPYESVQAPKSLRLALGQRPIQLGNIEFKILLYLASRPYHAFTRRSIAEAIQSDYESTASGKDIDQQVTVDNIDEYIHSLRDQLGVLHDYVQTVPYIGYRFKP